MDGYRQNHGNISHDCRHKTDGTLISGEGEFSRD